jgi:predicted dehydrogenase
MRVGVIGCGLIGIKRAEAIQINDLVACYDINFEASNEFATRFGSVSCSSLEQFFEMDLDVVIVATVHNKLSGLACKALEQGAHVLVEKPGGISSQEIKDIQQTAKKTKRKVHVGFNHRYYPGIARAIQEARSGEYGEIMYMRGRYGHGGRLGYEKEWRAIPEISGGGEIVDQGMHLLDLSYCLQGPLPLHSSLLRTQFWQAPVDDNAILILGKTGSANSAAPFSLIHVSWTDWKNTFSLEIACHTAKFAIDGLVRSYGAQVLKIYRMLPEMGPPELEEISYADDDPTWSLEWNHFLQQIGNGEFASGDDTIASALHAWNCIEIAKNKHADD